jgi:hypothetical protein
LNNIDFVAKKKCSKEQLEENIVRLLDKVVYIQDDDSMYYIGTDKQIKIDIHNIYNGDVNIGPCEYNVIGTGFNVKLKKKIIKEKERTILVIWIDQKEIKKNVCMGT